MKYDGAMVVVSCGDERARCYSEGGVDFDVRLRGVGWVVNTGNPSEVIVRLAMAARAAAFHFKPLEV